MSFSTANPSGSRLRAMAAARFFGDGVASSQPKLGRITSAQISTDKPREQRFCRLLMAISVRPAANGVTGRIRQSAAYSAPEAAHRSCQVLPAIVASQSSPVRTPRRTSAWYLALSAVNGAGNTRARTRPSEASVASHDTGFTRGGNSFAVRTRRDDPSEVPADRGSSRAPPSKPAPPWSPRGSREQHIQRVGPVFRRDRRRYR